METNYKGYSKQSGVYQILNTLNGRVYIGSAYEFKSRYTQHLKSLEKGTHHNKYLQNDWNKCGSSAFVFEVLEVVEGEQSERLLIEQGYINAHYDKQDFCYNFKKQAKADSRSCFSKDPSKSSELLSESSKRMWANRTEEERRRYADIMQAGRTKETYEKVSKSNTGKKNSPEHIEKTRAANLGRKHTEEYKQSRRSFRHTKESIEKIAATMTGRKRSKASIEKTSGANHWTTQQSFTEEARIRMRKAANERSIKIKAINLATFEETVFDSISEAARVLSLHKPNISNVLKGKQKQTKGYTFEVIN